MKFIAKPRKTMSIPDVNPAAFAQEYQGVFVDPTISKDELSAYREARFAEIKRRNGVVTAMKSIALDNARTWKDETIDFNPGLNVIVGSSDSGKSNLVRSIASVITNCPAGSMLSRGESAGQVCLRFNDAAVTLTKGKTTNLYVVSHSREPSTFESVGLSVPDKVSEILAMGEVDLGGERVCLNIQTQHASPIFVGDSPARIARMVGAVSGLDQIQRAVGLASTAKRDADTDVRRAREAAKSARDAYDTLRAARDLSGVRGVVNRADSAITALNAAAGRLDAIRDARDALGVAVTAVRRARDGVRAVGAVERAESAVAAVRVAADRLGPIARARAVLSAAVAAVSGPKADKDRLDRELAVAESELAGFRATLSVCPVCDRPMGGEHGC